MSTATKEVIKAWCFRSSNGTTIYQTLQYADAYISCDCPGWTKRVTANGGRDCKHVRMVQMGIADSLAITFCTYGNGHATFESSGGKVTVISGLLQKEQTKQPQPSTKPVRAFKFDE